MTNISEKNIRNFQKKIFAWWMENKRSLPWRKTTDPYYILIAEIMLQQTQVNRSIEKYLEFIEEFPSLEKLASAPISSVLKIWSGLGYNRRALWLQEAAKQIVELKEFPKTQEELQKLKGIGPYTSRSILIFAFHYEIATVDTNIRRILIAEKFAEEETKEKELFIIAQKLLPKGRARDWHNALMDYGSLVLTAAKTGIKPKTTNSEKSKESRRYRGLIVKYLTSYSKVKKEQIVKDCNIPEEKVNDILLGLIADGLVVKIKKNYTLPE
jgi:A/G-specific adenine glycosylase